MGESHKGQQYRHVPAFILLFLAMEESYGAALLGRMEKDLPAFRADSAVVYRSLQDLVDDGSVEQFWEAGGTGPVKKWYRITEKGRERLRRERADIEFRWRNLGFFLQTFDRLFNDEP